MKGIIFNLLEDVVINDHGQDTWDELLNATALDGAYTKGDKRCLCHVSFSSDRSD